MTFNWATAKLNDISKAKAKGLIRGRIMKLERKQSMEMSFCSVWGNGGEKKGNVMGVRSRGIFSSLIKFFVCLFCLPSIRDLG